MWLKIVYYLTVALIGLAALIYCREECGGADMSKSEWFTYITIGLFLIVMSMYYISQELHTV